ncbi:MAG: hypothetical protein AAB570_02715, partial [Patescibacteria group bacterium]
MTTRQLLIVFFSVLTLVLLGACGGAITPEVDVKNISRSPSPTSTIALPAGMSLQEAQRFIDGATNTAVFVATQNRNLTATREKHIESTADAITAVAIREDANKKTQSA